MYARSPKSQAASGVQEGVVAWIARGYNPYSGYFSWSKIFVVFVVERLTTKFLPKKQYRIPYSGYFSWGKIFVVFVVERRTTKFLPTKQYRIPYSGYFSWGKIFVVFVVERLTTNFLPTKQYRIPYSGYFLWGKIFVVFMVERRTTKFLPTKQYRIVPGCGLVYRDHENSSLLSPFPFTIHIHNKCCKNSFDLWLEGRSQSCDA